MLNNYNVNILAYFINQPSRWIVILIVCQRTSHLNELEVYYIVLYRIDIKRKKG